VLNEGVGGGVGVVGEETQRGGSGKGAQIRGGKDIC
jgi:hypothetical protein